MCVLCLFTWLIVCCCGMLVCYGDLGVLRVVSWCAGSMFVSAPGDLCVGLVSIYCGFVYCLTGWVV